MTSLRDVGRSIARTVTSNNVARLSLRTLSRAGLLPPWIWKRLPVAKEFPLATPDGGNIIYSTTDNDQIGRSLFWRGLRAWESETIPVLFKLATNAKLVLDIGANTGIYTLLACAANADSKVIAFEPVPRVYERLLNHVRLNGWEHRCLLYNQAVSSTEGRAKLHVPLSDLPSSASLDPRGFRGLAGTLIDVSVTTIDAVIPEQHPVGLFKMDVEGFEDKALQGMQRVLSTWKPTGIVECNPDGPYKAVETILGDIGYRFFHLREGGPVAVPRIAPHLSRRNRNFLFTIHDRWDGIA